MAKKLLFKSLIFTSILSMVFGVANQSAISKTATQKQQQKQLLAQSVTKYTCESYSDLNGSLKYRISPNIAGSFSRYNAKRARTECLVPISAFSNCKYKNSDSKGNWMSCGKVPKQDGARFTINYGGNGEKVEDSAGNEYRVFKVDTVFTLN